MKSWCLSLRPVLDHHHQHFIKSPFSNLSVKSVPDGVEVCAVATSEVTMGSSGDGDGN